MRALQRAGALAVWVGLALLCLPAQTPPSGQTAPPAPAQQPQPQPAQQPQPAPPQQPNPFENVPREAPTPPPTPAPQPAQPTAPAQPAAPAQPGAPPQPAAPVLPAPGGQYIEAIDITGLRRVPQDTVKALIQSKAGDPYSPEALRRDFMNLWNSGRFDNIRIESEPGNVGLIIRFVFTERRVIRSIDYVGLKTVTVSDVLDFFKERKIGLAVESPYDPNKIQHAAIVLKEIPRRARARLRHGHAGDRAGSSRLAQSDVQDRRRPQRKGRQDQHHRQP